mgnify:CR=1 FL=1|tara:strand:+ start:17452 stop:17934 length:483 start_codon:yes stop_codon:yes gene_type:complete
MKYIKENRREGNIDILGIYSKVFPKVMEYEDHNIWVNTKPGSGILMYTKLILKEMKIDWDGSHINNRGKYNSINVERDIEFNDWEHTYLIDGLNRLDIRTTRQLLEHIKKNGHDKKIIFFTTSANDKIKKIMNNQKDFKCIDLDNNDRDVKIIKKINDFN